jgi:hypothetical protein
LKSGVGAGKVINFAYLSSQVSFARLARFGRFGGGGNAENRFFTSAPKKDFNGFWGKLEYFLTGGNIGKFHYNIDGKVTGFAPIGGSPDFIGGPLKKGDKAIKLGKYLLNPKAYHAIKKTFLLKIGLTNFAHIVGKNPDISFKGLKIILVGPKLSPYAGKTYETGLNIIDFIKLFE